MTINEQPCTREDLRAIVLIESSWGVKDDGTVDETDHYGEGGGDAEYVDYYKCDNCGMDFEPEPATGATWPREEATWQAALDHLTKVEA